MTLAALADQRDRYLQKHIVVTGYYRWGYEESDLWPSEEAYRAGDWKHVTTVGSTKRLRTCGDLNLVIYGLYVEGRPHNLVLPVAVRVVR